MEVAGNLDGNAVAGFFLAVKMALEFDVDVLAAKNAGQMLDRAAGFGRASFCQRGSERTFLASGEADDASGVLREFVLKYRSFFFSLRAQLHSGYELAEILVSGAGGDQQREFEITGFQIFDFRLQIVRMRRPLKRCRFLALLGMTS